MPDTGKDVADVQSRQGQGFKEINEGRFNDVY